MYEIGDRVKWKYDNVPATVQNRYWHPKEKQHYYIIHYNKNSGRGCYESTLLPVRPKFEVEVYA